MSSLMEFFMTMYLNIKKVHPDSVIPKYAKQGDACFDLFSAEHPRLVFDDGLDVLAISEDDFNYQLSQNRNLLYIEYDTGIATEIPFGWKALAYARSSISKKALSLANSVGVVDSGYRGTWRARFRPTKNSEDLLWSDIYHKGDRVIQAELVPAYTVIFQEVKNLSESERGEGGFGSSGS